MLCTISLCSVKQEPFHIDAVVQIFVDLVKHLYDMDVLGEDTIQFWYKKGSMVRGRNVFLNDIQPFIKWLEDAEEDDDDEEEE